MRRLRVAGCNEISCSEGLVRVVEQCRNLRSLELLGAARRGVFPRNPVNPVPLRRLLRAICSRAEQHLHELSLCCSWNYVAYAWAPLSALHGLRTLRSLDISSTDSHVPGPVVGRGCFPSSLLRFIAARCSCLESLQLHEDDLRYDDGSNGEELAYPSGFFAELLALNTRLRSMSIRLRQRLSADVCREIVAGGVSLERLHLESSGVFSTECKR